MATCCGVAAAFTLMVIVAFTSGASGSAPGDAPGRADERFRNMPPLDEMNTALQFDTFFGVHRIGLVLYTTTDCMECLELTADLREAVGHVRNFSGGVVDVPIAKITHFRNDVTLRGIYFDEPHNSPAVPSIGVVRYGNVVRGRWRGPQRGVHELAEYILLLAKPEFNKVDHVAQMQEVLPSASGFAGEVLYGAAIGNASVVIFGFFATPHAKDSLFWNAFVDSIEWLRDMTNVGVFVTFEPSVAQHYGASEREPSVAVFHQATPQYVARLVPSACKVPVECRTTDCDASSLLPALTTEVEKWITNAARPFVHTLFNERLNSHVLVVRTSVMLYVAVNKKASDFEEEVVFDSVVDRVAVPLRRELTALGAGVAVGIQPVSAMISNALNFFGLSHLVEPSHVPERAPQGGREAYFVVVVNHDAEPYVLRDVFRLSEATAAMKAVDKFTRRVVSGREHAFVKSQAVTETDLSRIGSGIPLVVTARTFDSVLLRAGTTSLFLTTSGAFCSAHPDACSEANRVFRMVALAFKGRRDIVFGTVNVDENQIPEKFARGTGPAFGFVSFALKAVCEWYEGGNEFGTLWTFVASRQLDWDGITEPPESRPLEAALGLVGAGSASSRPPTDSQDEGADELWADERVEKAASWNGRRQQRNERQA